MKKFLFYALAGLLSFAVFLVVFAPAGPIWGLVSKQVLSRVPDLRVLSVDGTIWEGTATVEYRRFPTSTLAWKLAPGSLLERKAALGLHLFGSGHDLKSRVILSETQAIVLDANGIIESSYINAESVPQGLTFEGDISIHQFSLASDYKWFDAVAGDLSWPGGKLVSNLASGTHVFDLPPLTGTFSLQTDVWLTILHNQLSVVDINVQRNGWIGVRARARLFDIAKLPSMPGVTGGSSLDETVLQFEEKVF